MKKLLLSAIAISLMNVSFGAVHVIIASGTSFTPATTVAVGGDQLQFNISTGHTATSVSKATWMANGTTPNGAFNFTAPSGNYTIPGSLNDTIYFVCVFHVGMGMKGMAIVTPNGVEEASQEWKLTAFPNPADNFINLKGEGMNGKANVRVLDILGADVVPAADVDVTSYRINVATLAQGTYFIRVENGDRTKVIRFMKK